MNMHAALKLATVALATSALAMTAVGAPAATDQSRSSATATSRPHAPPERISLPRGFSPEGITTLGHTAYLGSLASGDIYAANLHTGRGRVISKGPGTPSVGMKVGPEQRLYVAGGDTGTARIIDLDSGGTVVDLQLTADPSVINDVVLTERAAWFTDSIAAKLYRVPIRSDGRLPTSDDVRVVALRGDWRQGEGFNANGITTTPDRAALLVVNSTSGALYRVRTFGDDIGVAREVRLGKATLRGGDGLLRSGRTLYVVQDQVTVVRLGPHGHRGDRVGTRSSSELDEPTTVARWADGLYVVNGRFDTEPTPRTPYWVTRLQL